MSVLDTLDPALRDAAKWLVDVARIAGLRPVVTSARRSSKKQAQLYDRYMRGLSPYPAAPPGTSKHERGLAFDVTVQPLSALSALGSLWESIGGRWGGRFKDPVHFEHP